MRITVVCGGRTPQRDVSLRSGHRVKTALAELGHDAMEVGLADVSFTASLQERAADLGWLTLHGKAGEDRTAQRHLGAIRQTVCARS